MFSGDEISPDPAKVESVTQWEIPKALKSLPYFLGFCGFYCQFIKNYSAIVRPLTELTKGYAPSKGTGTSEGKNCFKKTELFGDRWDQECTNAFNNIIYCLTHAPVLAFANPEKLYLLHVDASSQGLFKIVLIQEHTE
ncbi:hypothetical protein M9458_051365 [Cirrhinus mrigala]|uniref:Reverse transcriptase/retrotransposon-derived protein RNase H-like domain-containing protein n=1 Tax=Cirrhinus mrigala TaxID=683832 RepID=A0ABD0MWX3_CIRMR